MSDSEVAKESKKIFTAFVVLVCGEWTVEDDDDEQIRYFGIHIFILLTTHNNNNHIIKMRWKNGH